MKIELIAKIVCSHMDVPYELLHSKERFYPVVRARQMVYFMAYKHTSWGLEMISRWMQRDHSTVLQGMRKVQRAIDHEDPRFDNDTYVNVIKIEEKLPWRIKKST